jgi:hypothetical protein
MRRILLISICALCLPGCLASLGLQVGNTGAPATQPSVGPGGSFSTSSVNGRFDTGGSGASFGSILGLGVLGVLFGGEQRRAPALDAARPVQAQDCTKALPDPAANLRCR